jgi:hypothetical protein
LFKEKQCEYNRLRKRKEEAKEKKKKKLIIWYLTRASKDFQIILVQHKLLKGLKQSGEMIHF